MVSFYVKSLYRSMIFSATVLNEKYPELEPGPTLAAVVLMRRTDYQQSSSNQYEFTHLKTGKSLKLVDGDSLISVIHRMADLEVPSLLQNKSPLKQDEILNFIHKKIDSKRKL